MKENNQEQNEIQQLRRILDHCVKKGAELDKKLEDIKKHKFKNPIDSYQRGWNDALNTFGGKG